MTELFTQAWADEVRTAVNSFPDPEYKATKLDMFWDWIDVARKGFTGSFALGVRSLPNNGAGPRVLNLTIDGAVCPLLSDKPVRYNGLTRRARGDPLAGAGAPDDRWSRTTHLGCARVPRHGSRGHHEQYRHQRRGG